mgnify:CR=1 FL=1
MADVPVSYKIQKAMFEGLLLSLIAVAPSLPSLVFNEPFWVLARSPFLFMSLFLASFITKSKASRWFMLGFACSLGIISLLAVTFRSLTLSSQVLVNLCFYGSWVLSAFSVLLAYGYYKIFIVRVDGDGEEKILV